MSLRIILSILLAVCCHLSARSAIAAETVPLKSYKFKDIDGTVHDPFADEKQKAIVVVFISTDCPIANYYQPSLSRMAKQFADDGVCFFLVHPDSDLAIKDAKQHAKEYKSVAPVVLDKTHSWVKVLKATRTPEAFVVNRKGIVLYRGRIDNTFVDLGKKRRAGIRYDLKNAVQDVVDGRPVKTAETKPIGCFIPKLRK